LRRAGGKFRETRNSGLNKTDVPTSSRNGPLGIRVMPSKDERVELEMQIIKYRQIMSRTTNAEFLKQAEEKILELERKLREIEE
jgi:hypothetical protein